MSIRNDIKIVENINATLTVADKIKNIETHYQLDKNSSLDIDYQTILEMLSVYKDILQARPFVKVVGQNAQQLTCPDFIENPGNYPASLLTYNIDQYKQHIIIEHADLATSIDHKYKRSAEVINKYGYDKKQALLPQIKSRIVSYLHPTSLINLDFNTSKIKNVRQQFSDFNANSSLKIKS